MNICQNLIESLLSKVSLLSKISKQCFVFGHFRLFSQNKQLTLDWKFKNDWTKKLQKIPKKITVSLSFVEKLAEKICPINQVRSCVLTYTSQIAEEASSFFIFLFWFYDNQFSKIKFNLLEILEASHKHTLTMLVKLQAFIPQFNQFHPGCYYHIASLDGYLWIYV